MRALLPLAISALVLSGCVTPGADETPTAAADVPADPTPGSAPPPAPTTGGLLVLARMPDETLLSGVNVTVRNESRLTGPDGLARFDDLAPGTAEVVARKEAHRTAQIAVEIVAGHETAVEAILPANEGDQHAHEKGVFAHADVYRFEGHFDCSATYVIVTGDCLLIVDNATTRAGAPATPGEATSERHLIDFPLDATWAALVVEMAWTSTTPTPATGGEMSLALEPAEAPADGHAVKYARAYGGSPLRLELAPGVHHETATAQDMPRPEGGEVIRARAYVAGLANKPAGTEYLGVGAAAQHDFVLFVSIFYGEAPPAGYTALGSA